MLKIVSIQVCSLVYLVLLISIFFYKKKSHNFEGIIFQVFLLLTALTIILDIASNVTIWYQDFYPLVNQIVGKCYLVSAIIWCMWMIVYVMTLNSQKGYSSVKDLFKGEHLFRWGLAITFVFCLIAVLLKTTYVVDKIEYATYHGGPAIYYTFVLCFIFMGFMAIYMIINPKKISISKRVPIFLFLLFGLLSIVIQWIFSSVLLVSAVMAFVMQFIYFTMENPDLKIINDLEKDKEVVEEASKAKTDFLSNMSHDIRTPMNAIIGFSESLLTESLTDFQKGEVKNIYDAASTLLAIINNILDVSRIESGKEEKNEKAYEFRKIVMQLTSVITSKIDSTKIKFNIQIDKNVPSHFIGDELKIYQILMNLLANAVKYTNEGRVDFIITSENVGDLAKVKFVVADTGMGIKESDYDKIFVKFSRIHNQENYQSIEGTGLGLVITKKLVELLGGSITLTSEYGKGTVFTVIIPQTIDKDVVDDGIGSTLPSGTPMVTNVHFDGSLYDVLIVDDNKLNLKVAERILSDYKFHIVTASSGQECIEMLKNGQRFDLIFLDHMMPIMDGVQTLRLIKGLENVKIPPVVALTANAMVGMKEMYMSEGFDGYISKPIDREELQVLLNNFFCKK